VSEREDDAPPPVLGAWRNLYALVIGVLIVLIAAMWIFTARYR
jgi:hypothetical protein